ncbi:hypothetical protein GIB67_034146 [Kingdonia uniflora]|uniref:DNA topoisomerase (ATP-hydrolyzing) n=1 Tax=Kingdonia uniflora TaxID=39325 RepID=A0A7J7P4M3_9MAGN|nr:hypothetical protein GIB67_034146 [Kingdonia uniflora]
MEFLKLDNKVRFILRVVKGDIIVSNRKKDELFLDLKQKGFTPILKKTKNVEAIVAKATEEGEENEENSDVVIVNVGVKASDYEYLLSMAIGSPCLEKVKELYAEIDKLIDEVYELKGSTPMPLWMRNLYTLEKELDEQDNSDVKVEAVRKTLKGTTMNEAGMKGSKQVKTPRKTNVKKTNKISTTDVIGESGMVETPQPIKPRFCT